MWLRALAFCSSSPPSSSLVSQQSSPPRLTTLKCASSWVFRQRQGIPPISGQRSTTNREVGHLDAEALETAVWTHLARVHGQLRAEEGDMLARSAGEEVPLEPCGVRREAEDRPAVLDGREAHRDTPRVQLVGLLHAAPALVHQVKKLNLGVLPVQPPPLCYKRAVNSDRAKLSHAAVLVRSGGAADRVEETPREEQDEREPKRLKREDDVADETGDGEVVGALLAEHDVIHRVVHIQTLAVDARHRRFGVGRALVKRAVERATALDRVTCVQLHVHVANDDAIAFYHRLGFDEHQRIENYYRHLTPRTCLVLRRAL